MLYNTSSTYDDSYNGKPSKNPFFYSKLVQQMERLEKRIDVLEVENRAYKRTVKAQERKIKQLEEENIRLKNIINTNSKNSSKPPSTDQKPSKAPNEYNSRKKSHRSPGGQPGHSGTTLDAKKVEQGIREQRIIPRPSLPNQLTKYALDLEVNVIAHVNEECIGGVTYGPFLRSLAVDLQTEGAVSCERTCTLLNNLTGGKLELSVGSVYNFAKDFAMKCQDNLEAIKGTLLASDTMYTDATVVSVNGVQSYIRNHSTKDAVIYTAMQRKNLDSLKNNSLLSLFTHILAHDHETALYNFGAGHAECNAHLLRYLTKNTEESKNSWSGKLAQFLVNINNHRTSLINQGVTQFTPEELARYSKRYDEIIALGREQNKKTKPHSVYEEERSLLTRLRKYKDAQVYFMYNFEVEFTNNISERDLRKCKTKQKVSGGFRKVSGQQIYCAIMSIIETCKKRNMNTLDTIMRIQAGELVMGE